MTRGQDKEEKISHQYLCTSSMIDKVKRNRFYLPCGNFFPLSIDSPRGYRQFFLSKNEPQHHLKTAYNKRDREKKKRRDNLS